MKTLYEVLGVSATASSAEIKAAYLKLARLYHPDANMDKSPEERVIVEQRMQSITAAYGVVGDNEKRHAYNQTLRSGSVPDRQSNGGVPRTFQDPLGDILAATFGNLFTGNLFGSPKPVVPQVPKPAGTVRFKFKTGDVLVDPNTLKGVDHIKEFIIRGDFNVFSDGPALLAERIDPQDYYGARSAIALIESGKLHTGTESFTKFINAIDPNDNYGRMVLEALIQSSILKNNPHIVALFAGKIEPDTSHGQRSAEALLDAGLLDKDEDALSNLVLACDPNDRGGYIIIDKMIDRNLFEKRPHHLEYLARKTDSSSSYGARCAIKYIDAKLLKTNDLALEALLVHLDPNSYRGRAVIEKLIEEKTFKEKDQRYLTHVVRRIDRNQANGGRTAEIMIDAGLIDQNLNPITPNVSGRAR